MAGFAFELDPTSEDAGNTALAFSTPTYALLGVDLSPPPLDSMFASSADTEGSVLVQNRHRNRTITLKYRVTGSSASALETTLYQLGQKIGKLNRERGTLKCTTPTSDTIVFDIVTASHVPTLDKRYVNVWRATVDLTFECRPYGRGASVQLSDHTETSDAYLEFVETDIPGDVPALGRMVIDEDDSEDQAWMVWGLESRYRSADATAGPFYEAEGRTLMGGASVVTVTGASGGASNNAVRVVVPAGDLSTPLAMLSTQATGGGAHLTHVGSFRVFARVQRETTSTAGNILLALEWSKGDFRTTTRNPAVVIPNVAAASWRIVDLGTITIAEDDERWEGRLLTQPVDLASSVNLAVDYLLLVPTELGGEAQRLLRQQTASTFAGLEIYPSGSGSLNTKAALVGTWSTAGSGADFAYGSNVISRTATSDATTNPTSGRVAVITGTSLTDMTARALMSLSSGGASSHIGVIARYVDTSNFMWFGLRGAGGISVVKVIGGTSTNLIPPGTEVVSLTVNPGIAYQLRVTIEANGRWYVWLAAHGSPLGEPRAQGYDAVFKTGGTLASGYGGIFDWWPDGASDRIYSNIEVYSSPRDAVMFSGQSMLIDHESARREDSAGALFADAPGYEGDYLLLPPGGREGRDVRVVVKASRAPLGEAGDVGVDDISARVTYTPRYLVVPA